MQVYACRPCIKVTKCQKKALKRQIEGAPKTLSSQAPFGLALEDPVGPGQPYFISHDLTLLGLRRLKQENILKKITQNTENPDAPHISPSHLNAFQSSEFILDAFNIVQKGTIFQHLGVATKYNCTSNFVNQFNQVCQWTFLHSVYSDGYLDQYIPITIQCHFCKQKTSKTICKPAYLHTNKFINGVTSACHFSKHPMHLRLACIKAMFPSLDK